MSPKLKSLLARVTLAGGVAFIASYVSRHAPHDQAIVLRLHERELSRVEGFVARQGDDEPTAGFSRDFPVGTQAPSSLRHTFSAQNGTYIVVITLRARHEPTAAGDASPIPTETSFQRQVSLAGGEVIISPD